MKKFEFIVFIIIWERLLLIINCASRVLQSVEITYQLLQDFSPWHSIFVLRSSFFDLRSSFFDLRFSSIVPRSSFFDLRFSIFVLRSSIFVLRSSFFDLRSSCPVALQLGRGPMDIIRLGALDPLGPLPITKVFRMSKLIRASRGTRDKKRKSKIEE